MEKVPPSGRPLVSRATAVCVVFGGKIPRTPNNKPFKKLPGSRRSHFEKYEKPALKPLPKNRYEFVVIKKAQVNLDYHVEVDGHYYSVPNHYIGKTVEYHLGENSVSLIFDNQRIAIHKRSSAIRLRT